MAFFVNLKLITEGHEAINITCSHKEVKFKREIENSENKIVNLLFRNKVGPGVHQSSSQKA